MVNRQPGEYVILIVTRLDLPMYNRKIPLEGIELQHFRWTMEDFNQADRVDFLDNDGVSRTLKNRPMTQLCPIRTLGRPESLVGVEIFERMGGNRHVAASES